ncbi:MAG: hypothetical protein WBF66_00440 [Dehalococcoidia bacterium]
MLTAADDYLIHQTPDTFDRVATSDRNFYDRYYFSCHDSKGEVFLVLALGAYPNLGVMDAFTSAVHKGVQHIVRASRELDGDRMEARVGPLRVEVVEGLRRLRIACEPNQWGLAYDLTFEGVTPPVEEPRFLRRAGGRAIFDYTRLGQCGRWSGQLSVAGEDFAVEPEGWWGARDRSWGIRPVGDPEPPSALTARGLRNFFWQWAPMQFPDFSIMYTITEEADGRPWHQSAQRVYPYAAAREPQELTILGHELRLKPGTRLFNGGRVFLAEGGSNRLEIGMRPLAMMHMSGVGYVSFTDWRHGHYHGPLVVDGERWDLNDPELGNRAGDHSETVCEFTLGRQTGYGIFEFYCLGPYEPYGFLSATDVAK